MSDKVKRALIALSEAREALVGASDDASDERMRELRSAVAASEKAYREALIADDEERQQADDDGAPDDDGIDAEERERREILDKATLAGYIGCAATGQPYSGAEAEAAEAHGCPGAIPLEMWGRPRVGGRQRVEERVQTDPPAITDVVFHPTIHPLFNMSVAGYLGVDMPMVPAGVQQYPILETSLTAGPKAKGAATPETAAVYGNALTATPRRIGGGYRLRREDLAVLPRMESDLNMNMEAVIADTLDEQILNGDGTSPNLSGFFNQLTDVTAASAVVTFDSALKLYADAIDGLLARGIPDVRALVSTDAVKKLEVLFRSNDSPFGPSAGYLRMNTGGLRATNRIKAASNVSGGILFRTMSPNRPAVLPIWQGVEAIRDEITDKDKGEISITLYTLVGGPVLTRAAAYSELSIKSA